MFHYMPEIYMFHYMFHPPLKHIPIYEDAIQTLSIKKNGIFLDELWRLVFGFTQRKIVFL